MNSPPGAYQQRNTCTCSTPFCFLATLIGQTTVLPNDYAQHVFDTLWHLFFSSCQVLFSWCTDLANSDSTGSLKERLPSHLCDIFTSRLIVQTGKAMFAVVKAHHVNYQTCNLLNQVSDIRSQLLSTGPFHILVSFPQTQLQQSMSSETTIEIVLSFWLDTFFSIPSWIRSTDD